MKAVILAAGEGLRLRPLTEDTPKALVRVGGKPIAVWQIEWLRRHGVKEFIFAVNYLREKFPEELGDGSEFGVKIMYAHAEGTRGTAMSFNATRRYVEDEDVFLVVNGDVLTNLDPRPLIEGIGNGVGCMALVPLPSPYGVAVTDGGLVLKFIEKPIIYDYWINAGVYAFTPAVFEYTEGSISLEHDVFPRMAVAGDLRVVKYHNAVWKSIETVKDVAEAEEKIIPVLG